MPEAIDILAARWLTLWPLNRSPDVAPLLARYAEPHRHYHTAAHIVACLGELDAYRRLTNTPAQPLLELALFFHDAVYDPRADDNEHQSALLAGSMLQGFSDAADIGVISRLIHITDHRAPPTLPDEALMVDIDLSILGQPAPIFDAYERAIRAEYGHVPEAAFRNGRAAILRHFLARPHVYCTEFFGRRYEAAARANLERSLRTLTAPSA